MKYSQKIGGILCLVMIATSFTPWVYIASIDAVVSGMQTQGTNFGKPALVHIFLSLFSLILFAVPRVWAKRLNLFSSALNVAWSWRNFFVLTSCFGGECPEKKAGIYLILILSALILIMSTLPKIKVTQQAQSS